MSSSVKDVYLDLERRGLIYDISDKEKLFSLPKGAKFYIGFDPTAKSLQLGNLVGLIFSIHLSKAGLKPIILFGGATGMIGDPSGKSEERTLLSEEEVRENADLQFQQVKQILARAGFEGVEFVNNYDWFKDISFLEFLRDIGKHFTVNYMLAKDSVKSRMEGSGISFTEFSYMLLQAYDFYYLYSKMNCYLQAGGSDQWGNITAGLELIRKKIGEQKAVALSYPLITDKDGKKLGKTEKGAIWLDPELTSPYKLHQYLINLDDMTAVKLAKVFSLDPLEEIEQKEKEFLRAPETRLMQKYLADVVCSLVHSKEKTEEAKRCAQVLFGGSLEGLSDQVIADIFNDAPSFAIDDNQLKEASILDLFVLSKAVASKGEAKRLIKSGGLYVNNNRLEESQGQKKAEEFFSSKSRYLVLRVGKKSYYLVYRQ